MSVLVATWKISIDKKLFHVPKIQIWQITETSTGINLLLIWVLIPFKSYSFVWKYSCGLLLCIQCNSISKFILHQVNFVSSQRIAIIERQSTREVKLLTINYINDHDAYYVAFMLHEKIRIQLQQLINLLSKNTVQRTNGKTNNITNLGIST